jgi:hypothetical protein
MAELSPWQDPRTWTAIGSLCIGISGFTFGIATTVWNRRESRLDALSKVLQPLIKAAQHLRKANNARRDREQLRLSFPDLAKAQEASKRLEDLMTTYTESIKEAEKEFRQAESEFAPRAFRFPDKIAALTRKTFTIVSEYSSFVSKGMFDRADLHFALFRDDFNAISKIGRGWRLADPFEGIKQRWQKPKPKEVTPPFGLGKKELAAIWELVEKKAFNQTNNSFAVHAPKKLLAHPEILESDRIIAELDDSVFVVVFQDGTTRMLTLPEFVVFLHELISLKLHIDDVTAMLQNRPASQVQPASVEVEIKGNINLRDIMRPEMVKSLLKTVDFSNVPSDELDGVSHAGSEESVEQQPQEDAAP